MGDTGARGRGFDTHCRHTLIKFKKPKTKQNITSNLKYNNPRARSGQNGKVVAIGARGRGFETRSRQSSSKFAELDFELP
jgi:hypothetical protein